MNSTFETDFLQEEYSTLSASLERLLDSKEKRWGYFRVEKAEDGFYWLQVPSLPPIRFYQNEKNWIYRAFINGDKDRQLVFTRKKQRVLYGKKQRVIEIVYQAKEMNELRVIGSRLADLIKDKISAEIKAVSAAVKDEIPAKVVVVEE